jgi:YcaO-like protein with predicted kinase domain
MNNQTDRYIDLGSTIRFQTTESTLKTLRPHFKKLGITRVANITGLDCIDIPVAICVRPNSKHLSVSQGKGTTWELAEISAIMESIEGYHAENIPPAILKGSYQELIKKHPVINPELFLSGNFVIQNLPSYQLDWCIAEDVIQNQKICIPHILGCLDSTICHPEYSFFSVSSNGLAAGNTKEEAMCHALYEIIERDSLYQWSLLDHEARFTTQIKLDTIDNAMNQNLLNKLHHGKQLVKIWDITSIIGIPSFHCVIKDSHPWRSLGMFRGTGTHLSKDIALSRALTEAAQSRLALISGTRDDMFLDQYQRRSFFSYSEQEYKGERNYGECIQPPLNKNFQQDLNYLYQQLKKRDVNNVFMLEHTKPELNIPVVHLFVPGMQFNGARI